MGEVRKKGTWVDDTACARAVVSCIAESLDGAAGILEDLAEHPDMPLSLKSRVYALCDVVEVCTNRADLAVELLDR